MKMEEVENLVENSIKEIQDKGYTQIQYESALKWAARAVAAYRLSVSAELSGIALGFYEMGNSFFDEALEHAGIIESGKLVDAFSQLISEEKAKAYDALVNEPEITEEEIQQEEQAAEVEAPAEETKQPEEDSNEKS